MVLDKQVFYSHFLGGGQNIPFRLCGCRKWQPQAETPYSKLQDITHCSSGLHSGRLYVISQAFQMVFIAIIDSDSNPMSC